MEQLVTTIKGQMDAGTHEQRGCQARRCLEERRFDVRKMQLGMFEDVPEVHFQTSRDGVELIVARLTRQPDINHRGEGERREDKVPSGANTHGGEEENGLEARRALHERYQPGRRQTRTAVMTRVFEIAKREIREVKEVLSVNSELEELFLLAETKTFVNQY